jgi:hypothetical protein
VEKTAKRFLSFAEAEKADRDFYKKLTGNAFATKVSAELDGIPVFVLARDALIRNKRAVGQPQHLADLDVLES